MIPMLCATGCATTNSDMKAAAGPSAASTMPPWPLAGAAVANELDRVCPITIRADGTKVSNCPAIDEWLGRLGKFKLQLEAK